MANAYNVVGFTYEADLHCPECATKRFSGLNVEDDSETPEAEASAEIYCAGLKNVSPVGVPWLDREGNPPHAVFDYQNDGYNHGCNCGTCGEEIFRRWCDGCEECANDLEVVVEDRDDDPWTATVHVCGTKDQIKKWIAWKGGYIGGDSWEISGGTMVYALPGAYVGCVEDWKKEGYTNLDLSSFTEDPLEAFAGLDAEEIDEKLKALAESFGDDWPVDDVRADIEVWSSVSTDDWRREDPKGKIGFSEWRDAQVEAARKARNGE